MKKTFSMENDIGLMINYSIIAEVKLEKDYIIYTDFMPSNNEVGVRLFVGLLEQKDPIIVKKVSKTTEQEIIDDFKMHIFQTNDI